MKFVIIFFAACVAVCLASPISDAPEAKLVHHEEDHSPEGYNVNFALDNGHKQTQHAQRVLTHDEEGNDAVYYKVAGSYEYYSPEGELVKINYVADENGFQASGDALPKPVEPLHPQPAQA